MGIGMQVQLHMTMFIHGLVPALNWSYIILNCVCVKRWVIP